MPEGGGLGAACGFKMVGAKPELAADESAAELLTLLPETEGDADRNLAKTTATETTSTIATIAIQREKVKNR
jgi:hypothetical protein